MSYSKIGYYEKNVCGSNNNSRLFLKEKLFTPEYADNFKLLNLKEMNWFWSVGILWDPRETLSNGLNKDIICIF